VVLPVGAAAKEHGPHLLLRNDQILAEAYAERVRAVRSVVVLPTVTYAYYPAFLEYPGSTSLSARTQQDVIAQILRSVAAHGPRRFYVLNTGLSTLRPLRATAEALAGEGLLVRVTDPRIAGVSAEDAVREQAFGTHADEIETSVMLFLAPDTVRMERAVKDGEFDRPGGLTRDPLSPTGSWSRSGVFGDPTLATAEKGRRIVEGTMADILAGIDALARDPLPAGHPGSPLD
jgi:creatinine amidohydrolase